MQAGGGAHDLARLRLGLDGSPRRRPAQDRLALLVEGALAEVAAAPGELDARSRLLLLDPPVLRPRLAAGGGGRGRAAVQDAVGAARPALAADEAGGVLVLLDVDEAVRGPDAVQQLAGERGQEPLERPALLDVVAREARRGQCGGQVVRVLAEDEARLLRVGAVVDPAALADGDAVVVDVEARELRAELSADELDARLRDWRPPPPRYSTGVFAKYAAVVSSASEGAVTRPAR